MGKPKIRFKGYTEDWEQRKLSELLYLSNEKNDGSYTRDDVLAASLGTELQKKHIYFGLRATDESVKNYKVVLPKDVIYTKSPIKGFPNGIIRTNKGETGIVPTLYCVYHSIDTINPSIIQAYFESKERLDAYLVPLVNIGARNNVNITDKEFINGSICIPKNETEQNRIVDLLEKISNLITLHQRKCEETKKLKKYMLQKMFPKNGESVPEIRFAGFTDAWEQRKFSDIAARESSVSASASDIPSVEYEDVVAEEGRLNKDIRLKEAVKSGITFDGSQVLYGKLRPYLHNWLNPDFKGIAVGDWWVLKPINMDKNFLYRLIQTQQFDNIANQSSGSKMPRADWNLISNSEFMVPFSKEEQSKIGRCFDSLDQLITLHQRKCDELKNMKQYMLQNMFV